jgi:DNA sulfur modification protein DndB
VLHLYIIIHNQNHSVEMKRAKKSIVQFINLCYGFVEEKYPIFSKARSHLFFSNRGTFAYINLLGSLNQFETSKGSITVKSTPVERFEIIQKYINALLKDFSNLTPNEKVDILKAYGTGAEDKWVRFFQSIVNKHYKQYAPTELLDWNERQDESLQSEGRKFLKKIESTMKKR